MAQENYSKDIDLWQVIQNGDFYYELEDSETKLMKETPYEFLEDDQKKNLGKNNEAKMTLYNSIPHKEYSCIDLLTQEYEKFLISNEETIDSGFTQFNAIVTSLKSLDPDYSSKNHVYEMFLDNDGVGSKTTKEKVKSLALKAKVTREKTSDDSNSQGGSNKDIDEEEAKAFNLLARNFCKFFRKDIFIACHASLHFGNIERNHHGWGNIDNLTMEQYLTLTRGNQAPSVAKPEIRGSVNFEIKSQFMRELREDTFTGNKKDDAHEHVKRILDIVSLFNILGVTHDAVMLRVFPITLTGAAKRWVDRLTPGTINTWDLLKKAFIQRYCPPSKTAKQLEDIRNFKQEGEETFYQAWERYNDLLYKCPNHDINSHQKVNIFYNGLSIMNRQLLNSHGPIPGMTPAEGLKAIQTMADHSQKWHDGSPSRSICGSNNSEGMDAIASKLVNLGRDMKKLKENVHTIQVGCQLCGGPHLDKECPLCHTSPRQKREA
ncbi:hypothetical protein Tco_1051072 [Tanacetum coccineum]